MTQPAERPLAEYNMFDPAVQEDPWGYYRKLRDEAPVYRDPNTGIVQVSTYELVLEVLKQPELFSNRFGLVMGSGQPPPELEEVMAKGWPPVDTMLTADPPEHKRFRGLVNKAFTPRRVNGIEPTMHAITSELIDAFIGRGRVELVGELAVPLPLTVISDQLGVPRKDLARFKRWTDAFLAQLGGMASLEEQVEAARQIVDFQHYTAAVLEERRSSRREDIISDLVHARLEGERPLDTAECLSILQQLLVAGNETTASSIAEGTWLLIQNPDQLALVRERPELVEKLVEEVLRLSSPTANMWRVVKQDTVLGGVELSAGSMLMVRFGAADRDESVFPDPERFWIERPNASEHLAFGHGIHFCIGAMLARREMKVAFTHLLERLDGLRLAPGHPVEHKPNILLRGLRELWLEFEAR